MPITESRYGAVQTNPITDEFRAFRDTVNHSHRVELDDPDLSRIVRLRLLSDPTFPFIEVSYCYGVLKDGQAVVVNMPFHQMKKKSWKGDLLDWAREHKVFLSRLGMWDDATVSVCR